jgi:hypothetical protein
VAAPLIAAPATRAAGAAAGGGGVGERRIGTAVSERAWRVFKIAGGLRGTTMREAMEHAADLLADELGITDTL